MRKLNVKFTALEAQRERLETPSSKWNMSTPVLKPRGKLYGPRDKHLEELNVGINCNINEIKPRPDHSLSHKGEQVLIYIKDNTHLERRILERDPLKLRRFHVVDCFKLEEMREEGSYEKKYVATCNMDGNFRVDVQGEKDAIFRLMVCMFCLEKLNWEGYNSCYRSEQYRIRDEFSIREFLSRRSSSFRTRPIRRDRE